MALQDTDHILGLWPKDVPHTDLQSLGLDRPELLERLQRRRENIKEFTLAAQKKSSDQLVHLIKKTSGEIAIIAKLMQAGEKPFMDNMKTSAAKLARAQAKLEFELENLSKVAFEAGGAQEAHSRARELSAQIQYFVGIFTSITLYRIPETWSSKAEKGKGLKKQLVAALEMITDNGPIETFEHECAHDIVRQMRIDAKVQSSPKFSAPGKVSSQPQSAAPNFVDPRVLGAPNSAGLPCDAPAASSGLSANVASGQGSNPDGFSSDGNGVPCLLEAFGHGIGAVEASSQDANAADVPDTVAAFGQGVCIAGLDDADDTAGAESKIKANKIVRKQKPKSKSRAGGVVRGQVAAEGQKKLAFTCKASEQQQ